MAGVLAHRHIKHPEGNSDNDVRVRVVTSSSTGGTLLLAHSEVTLSDGREGTARLAGSYQTVHRATTMPATGR